MRPLIHHLRIPLVLIAFVAGSFAIGNGSTTCLASAPHEHVIGDACTSEVISMATVWTWSESTTALPAQKLLLLVAVLGGLATVAFPKIAPSVHGLTWFNRRVNLVRTGPSPNHLFLPYLFATHGW
ncbi:MAG: hypothetical protein NUV84_04525 [Candidatus Uhrbacteria bacterium]|nr:hypothetical protein [Candidatus Uhrbacteria bacterium]